MATPETAMPPPDGPDRLRVGRWLAVHLLYVAALLALASLLLARSGVSLAGFAEHPIDVTVRVTEQADAAPKLLIFCAYVSMCCTFLPLPANVMVSAVAIQQFAPYPTNIWATTLAVATVGAWASMMANLLDFHLFTLMLRHKGIARVRHTRLYERSARWFASQPFAILVVFNILPIPIDVVRMLAATCRYALLPFAAANFLGRWFRYAVLAFVTYKLAELGWVATVALLAVAVVMAAPKLLGRWLHRRRAGGEGPTEGTM